MSGGGENLKWYHKLIYSAANAILPASVKRQMMGVGRSTVTSNSNNWGIFNWLPKKYQSAHNIDLTKLQSYTAEELLELLISVHPDISHALYTYLRMGDTELTFTAKKNQVVMTNPGNENWTQLRKCLKRHCRHPATNTGGHSVSWIRFSA